MKSKCFILIFILIIFLPIALGIISEVNGMPVDVPLNGYFDAVTEPQLSFESFSSGNFQSTYSNWFSKTHALRGVMIKTYNSIQYYAFQVSNRTVGANNDIFDQFYIDAELCIGDEYDFSLPQNREKMETYVAELKEVQAKLSALGKGFVLYLTPSKAHYNRGNIPYRYMVQERDGTVKAVDYFRELMDVNGVPYIDTYPIAADLPYPPFYSTGIHWARPLEQTVTNIVIEEMNAATGKHFRTIELGDVVESENPFWRDTDVLALTNTWGIDAAIRQNTYYQFTENREQPAYYDRTSFFVQGGSFSEGLVSAIHKWYPDSDVNRINYANFCQVRGQRIDFNGDWSKAPVGELLDSADCVVVELNEGVVMRMSDGFIHALNTYLDTYQPTEYILPFAEKIVAQEGFVIPTGALMGCISGTNNGPPWTSDYVVAYLNNDLIASEGLDIAFSVRQQIFTAGNKSDTVRISVNGVEIYSNSFTEPWDGVICFTPDQLPPSRDGLYTVTIQSDAYFVPAEIGENADPRHLYLYLEYIGPHMDAAEEGRGN